MVGIPITANSRWNAKAFPDPKGMIQQLHDEHFHVVLHIVVEGKHYSGTVRDACTAPSQPPGRTPDGHWPAEPAGELLLARSQAPTRSRRGWLVARPGRRLRCSVAPCAEPHVLRGSTDVPAQPARLRATPQWLRRHAAVCFVLMVGRRSIHLGNAEDACAGRSEYGFERHSVLGNRYWRIHSYA